MRSCWKSAQITDDAENLSCLLNIEIWEKHTINWITNFFLSRVVLEDASDSVKSFILDQSFHPKLNSNMSDNALETIFF